MNVWMEEREGHLAGAGRRAASAPGPAAVTRWALRGAVTCAGGIDNLS